MEQCSVQCDQALLSATLLDALEYSFVRLISELWWVGDVRKAHNEGTEQIEEMRSMVLNTVHNVVLDQDLERDS